MTRVVAVWDLDEGANVSDAAEQIERLVAEDGTDLHRHATYAGSGVMPIRPGDLVERVGTDLDYREVVAVGRDWLTLDILGHESERLPLDNYRTAVPAEGSL